MKGDKLKVTIIGLEDEKAFSELLAELKVTAVMKMCPPELRMQVLDDALKRLITNQWIGHMDLLFFWLCIKTYIRISGKNIVYK